MSELDLREQLVRIDRSIAETRKFQAESDKLSAEPASLAGMHCSKGFSP